METEKQQLLARLAALRQQVGAMRTPEQSRLATIELLHRYNAVKDATQTVIGVVADFKQCTTAAVHKELDLPLD